MGRIINNESTRSSIDPIDDLCCDIYQGKYVLLVGGDVILREGMEGGLNNKAFFDYHVRQFLKEKNIEPRTLSELKGYIADFLEDNKHWNYNIEEEVNEDFLRLMETKCFRVVITTTYDGYIEAVLRNTWGKALQVFNIYNYNFDMFNNYSEYYLVPPTLIYAVGKAGSPTAKFAYTDDDMIELIATRWLDSTKRPNKLINYLRQKKILGIGCKLDDWEFRFFWYSLRQDLERLNGDVAISLDIATSETDRKLSQYLTSKQVKNKGMSRDFLHTLQCKLNSPNENVYKQMKDLMVYGGVFISYGAEDFPIACQIYRLLHESGFAVWFDNKELKSGDSYNERIATAIKQSKVFISVLSQNTALDLKTQKRRYYMEEWRQIADNKECVIIPLTLYGFDIKEYRELLPIHLSNKTIFNWTENSAKDLINFIKTNYDE